MTGGGGIDAKVACFPDGEASRVPFESANMYLWRRATVPVRGDVSWRCELLAEIKRFVDLGGGARRRRTGGHATEAFIVAVLRIDACLSGLRVFRIVRIVTEVRTASGLLELYEFGLHLRTRHRRVRLSESGDRSGKGSGDDDSLNERFHDYYLQKLFVFAVASCSLR